jgi:hypothetical protein
MTALLRYFQKRTPQRPASEKSEFERAFDSRAAKRVKSAVSEILETQPGRQPKRQ